MTISVHDYADVPTGLLSVAEEQSKNIYLRAGLETVWLNCSAKLEKIEAESCRFCDNTHLTLKILPHAVNAQVRDRIDVLGTAYPSDKGGGYFAYVFYDRVQELAKRKRLGHALLADVMAHEIGHLLLGSNSHSLVGIMSGNWSGDGLRRVSQRGLFFDPSESRIMRQRLNISRAHVETSEGNPRSLPPLPASSEAPDQDPDSTTLKIEIYSGFLVVARGEIQNLHDLKFIVDTGVTNTVIDRKLADKLRLRRSAGMVFSFDGFKPVRQTTIEELKLGPLRTTDLRVYVADLLGFSALAKNVDGIVGMDVLASAKRFRIDYENRSLFLEPAEQLEQPRPVSKYFAVPATIQGISTRLLVDTGFPGILLYRDRLLRQHPEMGMGHSTKVKIGHLHLAQVELPQVQIGGLERTAKVFLIDGPVSNILPNVDGYLGPSSLGTKWVEFNVDQHILRWQ